MSALNAIQKERPDEGLAAFYFCDWAVGSDYRSAVTTSLLALMASTLPPTVSLQKGMPG